MDAIVSIPPSVRYGECVSIQELPSTQQPVQFRAWALQAQGKSARPAPSQVNMRRQVVFFSQLNPVFIPESVFGRHGTHGIAKLAIPEAALQFTPGHSVTRHSRTE